MARSERELVSDLDDEEIQRLALGGTELPDAPMSTQTDVSDESARLAEEERQRALLMESLIRQQAVKDQNERERFDYLRDLKVPVADLQGSAYGEDAFDDLFGELPGTGSPTVLKQKTAGSTPFEETDMGRKTNIDYSSISKAGQVSPTQPAKQPPQYSTQGAAVGANLDAATATGKPLGPVSDSPIPQSSSTDSLKQILEGPITSYPDYYFSDQYRGPRPATAPSTQETPPPPQEETPPPADAQQPATGPAAQPDVPAMVPAASPATAPQTSQTYQDQARASLLNQINDPVLLALLQKGALPPVGTMPRGF